MRAGSACCSSAAVAWHQLEREQELRFELNHKSSVGEVRHRSYRAVQRESCMSGCSYRMQSQKQHSQSYTATYKLIAKRLFRSDNRADLYFDCEPIYTATACTASTSR